MHSELHPVRRRGAAACRDTADQLTAIRRIVAEVAAAMPPPTIADIDPPMAFAPNSLVATQTPPPMATSNSPTLTVLR